MPVTEPQTDTSGGGAIFLLRRGGRMVPVTLWLDRGAIAAAAEDAKVIAAACDFDPRALHESAASFVCDTVDQLADARGGTTPPTGFDTALLWLCSVDKRVPECVGSIEYAVATGGLTVISALVDERDVLFALGTPHKRPGLH